jgi:hypothetical protein
MWENGAKALRNSGKKKNNNNNSRVADSWPGKRHEGWRALRNGEGYDEEEDDEVERARNRASPTLVATATQAEKHTTKAPPQQQQQSQADKEGATSNSNYHPPPSNFQVSSRGRVKKKSLVPKSTSWNRCQSLEGSPFTLYSSLGTYYVLPP